MAVYAFALVSWPLFVQGDPHATAVGTLLFVDCPLTPEAIILAFNGLQDEGLVSLLLQCYAQRWCCGAVLALSGLVLCRYSATLNAGAVVVSSPSLGSSSAAVVLRSTLVLW